MSLCVCCCRSPIKQDTLGVTTPSLLIWKFKQIENFICHPIFGVAGMATSHLAQHMVDQLSTLGEFGASEPTAKCLVPFYGYDMEYLIHVGYAHNRQVFFKTVSCVTVHDS